MGPLVQRVVDTRAEERLCPIDGAKGPTLYHQLAADASTHDTWSTIKVSVAVCGV